MIPRCSGCTNVMALCCMQIFNFVTALSPFSPTFDEDNQRDVRKRPAGPTQKPLDPSKPAVRDYLAACAYLQCSPTMHFG